MVKTYQDLQKASNIQNFVIQAINEYKSTKDYKIAVEAVAYDKCYNDIKKYQKFLYNSLGEKYNDEFAANNQLPSNFFNQLITQENEYSLANGVNFTNTNIDKQLGPEFDSAVDEVARLSLVGGKAFMYVGETVNVPFSYTEFVPLYDENNGELQAGIRFYRQDTECPLNIWLYEIDGETYFRQDYGTNNVYVVEEKKPYKLNYQGTTADGMVLTYGENYNGLPIVEFKANRYEQSELVYIKDKIDAYDRTLSDLQNDLDENQFIYWIIKNSGGMDEVDFAQFKQRLKTSKIANVDGDEGTVEHFEKDVPYQARKEMLGILREDIYNSLSCVDMSKLSAGAVNETQINAMYSAMDNKASYFENYIRKFVQQVLLLKGIDVAGYDIYFLRNKLQSQQEDADVTTTKVNYIMQTANEVDEETVLNALKVVVPEYKDINVNQVLKDKDSENDMTEDLTKEVIENNN